MPRSSNRRSTTRRKSADRGEEESSLDHSEDDAASASEEALSKSRQEKRRQQEIKELEQEYDIAAPARTDSGHLKRKVPRAQWKARTRQRKRLEQADEKQAAESAAMDQAALPLRLQQQKRWRGLRSRAAFEQQVIQESHDIFAASRSRRGAEVEASSSEEEEDDDDEEEEEEDQKPAAKTVSRKKTSEEQVEDDGDFQDDDDNEEEDEDYIVDDGEEIEEEVDDESDLEEEEKEEESDLQELPCKRSRKKKAKAKKAPRSMGRRRLFRLRNFQSQRMAQRHGEAMAAHARGQPREAIRLLKLVAKDAPSAPQIYSSLAMVYEDMLRESHKRRSAAMNNDARMDPTGQTRSGMNVEGSIPDPALAEQLDLAQKAYGSYHVAAILCRRDYMLWVRAADAGAEIVRVLEQAILLQGLSPAIVAYLRSEKKRWLSEVLRDLSTADKLHPPGIDVPCKLAVMHMEVGNLSEALAVLTDLTKREVIPTMRRGRSEFQSSYSTWLLYADLMLRVGHECIQWNRDVRSNDNLIFRRWLRKYAQIFDWQERRLQALSLALEAAAGTKSTARFIQWMKDRACKKHGQSSHGKGDGTTANSKLDINGNSAQHDSEKDLMLAKHCSEMEAFDRTTHEMDLTSNSVAAEDRQSSRDELLQAQQDAVTTLNREYDESEKQSQAEKEDDEMMVDFHDSLPISASCREVCRIASETMKHLHGLELFEGARLVGDSVSDYLKERAKKHDLRSVASKRAEEWQEKMLKPSFLFESYEEGSEDDFSNEGDSPFLSDDEGLDNEDNAELLESLRRGIMPPELRILYGLALIGEGGRNFLAGKCLEAIDDLEQESSSWLTDGEWETEASGEPLWYLFQRAMTEPLGRTAAYAFLADVLRKTKKEKEWSVHFSSRYRKHLATLESVGLKEQLTGLCDDVSPFVNFRKNQLLKVVLAAISFDIDAAESPAQQSPVNRELIVTDDNARVKIAIAAMKSLADVLHLMWKVDSDGSIPSICTEVLKVISRCYRWLAKEAKVRLSFSQLHAVLGYATTFLSFLCGVSTIFPDFKSSDEIAFLLDQYWGALPIKANWQALEYRPLSLRTYNLTVACNVSLFSGWESEEFTFQLLRRRHGHKHFGVHLRERRITGYLNTAIEEEISRQWGEVLKLLPSFPDIKFRDRVEAVKESEWYKTEVEDRKNSLEGTDIARYGEESAEEFYLAFSALCLHLAASEKNAKVINRLLHASLSILIPVSQFCVDDRLWDSDIGEAASSLSGFDEWKLLNRMDVDTAMDQLTKISKRYRKSEKVIERKLQEWIRGTDKPTLLSFVSLKTSDMRQMWFKDSNDATQEEKDTAVYCMRRVHTGIDRLRGCYTESAVEKACLQISIALLELASLPGCFDPFRCLQQAVLFSSQACKAGNSDLAYREKLPEKSECTPLQALVILGRADCLHSVYFPNEAAFLCSYVATICRCHRENAASEDSDVGWSVRWKIVAIYAYNVSVMIRTSVSTVLDKQQQKSFLSMWERDVVEELERGRSDGWVWKRALGGGGRILPPDDIDADDFEADEAENSLGDKDNESDEEEVEEEDDAACTYDDDEVEAQHEEMTETAVHPAILAGFPYELPFPLLPIPDFVATAATSRERNGLDVDNDIQGIEMVTV